MKTFLPILAAVVTAALVPAPPLIAHETKDARQTIKAEIVATDSTDNKITFKTGDGAPRTLRLSPHATIRLRSLHAGDHVTLVVERGAHESTIVTVRRSDTQPHDPPKAGEVIR